MKTNNAHALVNRQGHALLLVLVFLAVSAIILAGAMNWSRSNTFLNARNNQYFRSLAAAEAATEKVLTHMKMDYDMEGENMVLANLDLYRTMIPSSSENRDWNSYTFYDLNNAPNRVSVENSKSTEYRDLTSQYRGLRGYATPLRISSRVRETGLINVVGGIQQDVDLASIPIFQFAIFYNIDLEINPGPPMNVTGPVHCNANIYMDPQSVLTFHSDVTAAGEIIHDKKPGDPLTRAGGSIHYRAEHISRVSSLNLPIGTNNSPDTVRQIVEVPPPPWMEAPTSLMGRQRFYNKADMIILVTNGVGGAFDPATVVAHSGGFNVFSTPVPASEVAKFLILTNSFQNHREGKRITVLDLDIAKLRQWNAGDNVLKPVIPRPSQNIQIVFIADRRTGRPLNTEPGVRLINGQQVLPDGLTVASPNPVYIKGHYNAVAAHLGSTNTSQTRPAAVIGDAITILSSAFNDRTGGGTAVPTTVNAALLAGIVPTIQGSYSGGVENFPRFLEEWGSGNTFTYNGSMVVMYESKWAIAQWGQSSSYYDPPKRNWAFDQNFREVTKLPPGTPMMRVLVRGNWAKL